MSDRNTADKNMADKTANADRFVRNPQGGITAATAIGMNALKPIMSFQISMLRMWADSLERFAGKYDKGLEETTISGDEQPNERSGKERAA